jgi:hypothetical protein
MDEMAAARKGILVLCSCVLVFLCRVKVFALKLVDPTPLTGNQSY